MKICIVGGDRRMLFTKNELERKGIEVTSLGLTDSDNGNITSSDAVLLPVPVSRDKVNINCPLTNKTIPIDLLKDLPETTKILGGGKLDLKNYTDYLSLDEYAVKNAVLTAEGAIAEAIVKTDFSLWKSPILIIGYGRVGKVLTNRLMAFNPRLTVSARSGKDISMLEALGIDYIRTPEIQHTGKRFSIVFNTVDIKFDFAAASALSETHFFDLSSHGGFIDKAAEKYGIKYLSLPSLPAKTAPVTAGVIIAETVIELLKA